MTDGNTHPTPHLSDDDLVLHYYGELPAVDEAQAITHLSSCGACHEGYRKLQRLLAAVDDAAMATPELPANFERTVWARLEPNLQRRDRRWFSWFVLSPARLAWVCGIVALVGAAFRQAPCADFTRSFAALLQHHAPSQQGVLFDGRGVDARGARARARHDHIAQQANGMQGFGLGDLGLDPARVVETAVHGAQDRRLGLQREMPEFAVVRVIGVTNSARTRQALDERAILDWPRGFSRHA